MLVILYLYEEVRRETVCVMWHWFLCISKWHDLWPMKWKFEKCPLPPFLPGIHIYAFIYIYVYPPSIIHARNLWVSNNGDIPGKEYRNSQSASESNQKWNVFSVTKSTFIYKKGDRRNRGKTGRKRKEWRRGAKGRKSLPDGVLLLNGSSILAGWRIEIKKKISAESSWYGTSCSLVFFSYHPGFITISMSKERETCCALPKGDEEILLFGQRGLRANGKSHHCCCGCCCSRRQKRV